MSRLHARGLHKRFGDRELLAGLDLRVEPGETVVLRGPNGAGKSTLLGCLAGTVAPDAGTVVVDGHDLRRDPLAARRALRYLPQEVVVPPGVSGRELLALLADAYGGGEDLPAAAAATGLGPALEHLATTYSVGMRRLLAFGALALGPGRVFVLDEPFAGVDDEGRARMLALLVRVRDEGGAVVLATHGHDVAAVDALAPRTVVLGRDTPRTERPAASDDDVSRR